MGAKVGKGTMLSIGQVTTICGLHTAGSPGEIKSRWAGIVLEMVDLGVYRACVHVAVGTAVVVSPV
jgi:hypothetical protein